MVDNFNKIVSGRAVICGMLIITTAALYYFDKGAGANGFMLLSGIAVRDMFSARAAKEKV